MDADEDEGSVSALNLFDSALSEQYVFAATPHDMLRYGDHFIVALGDAGLAFFH